MARQVPADFEDALASNRVARDRFWAMPADQKDAWVGWISRARLPGTRRRRIAEAVRRLGGAAQPRRRTTAVEEPAAAVVLPREDWWAWVLGLVLLAALATFLVWLTVYRHHSSSGKPAAVVVSSKATVPKVTGIRVQAAQFQLNQAKLSSKVVHKAAAKPKGIVVGQTPKPDTTVAQGSLVTLVVSNGPPGVQMPDVTGLAAADAVRALQARGLAPTLQQIASTQPPGTVVAQTPKPGQRAKRGTKVVLQVAKGQSAVAVPNVVGQSQQQATAALQQAGFKATVAQVPSSQSPGTVVAQNPPAGQKAAQGSSVRLNVAKGAPKPTTTSPPTTTAPVTTTKPPATGNDYTGMRLTQAVQKIAQGRQQVIVQYVASTQPAGVIVSNSNSGSRVSLQVSAGPHPKQATSVPDVTGQDAATAQRNLETAGFSVLEVQWPVSDQSRIGTVTYETPAGGGQAPQGATVVLYIASSG